MWNSRVFFNFDSDSPTRQQPSVGWIMKPQLIIDLDPIFQLPEGDDDDLTVDMDSTPKRRSDPGSSALHSRRSSVQIPIQKIGSNDALKSTPTPSLTEIERQLEAEVERSVKGTSKPWQSRVKGLTQKTLHIRPRSSCNQSSDESNCRLPRRQRLHSSPVMSLPRPPHEIPEIDVIRREDTAGLLDTSAESLDEDARRPLYSRCPTTGRQLFKLEFDVRGYDQENITVRVTAGRLVVHAVQREAVDGRKTTNEFCRKIKLPSDVDSEKLHCVYSDNGRLLVESPVVIRSSRSLHNFPSCSTLNGTQKPKHELNKPVVMDQPEALSGKAVHVHVEIGRVFQSNDVLVKVKGHDKVIVTAEKEDVQPKSRMMAKLTREFELPERILPQTLRAGLTLDGVLKVSAHVERSSRNGHPEKTNESDAVLNGEKNGEKSV